MVSAELFGIRSCLEGFGIVLEASPKWFEASDWCWLCETGASI